MAAFLVTTIPFDGLNSGSDIWFVFTARTGVIHRRVSQTGVHGSPPTGMGAVQFIHQTPWGWGELQDAAKGHQEYVLPWPTAYMSDAESVEQLVFCEVSPPE